MKTLIKILLLLFTTTLGLSQQTQLSIPNYFNESIEYKLNYGIVKIGVASLKFGKNSSCSGAFIFADARSTGITKFIKNIHYRYESCMDTRTGLPIYDSRKLIQGDIADINTTYYFHTFRNDSSLVYSLKTDTVIVPKNLYDLLSGFYKFRTNYVYTNMVDSAKEKITTFFVDEVWDINLTYQGTEVIETIFGDIECLNYSLETIVGRFFPTNNAMTIWFAKTGDHIPIKFCAKLKIGTLYGEITNYQPPDKRNQKPQGK